MTVRVFIALRKNRDLFKSREGTLSMILRVIFFTFVESFAIAYVSNVYVLMYERTNIYIHSASILLFFAAHHRSQLNVVIKICAACGYFEESGLSPLLPVPRHERGKGTLDWRFLNYNTSMLGATPYISTVGWCVVKASPDWEKLMSENLHGAPEIPVNMEDGMIYLQAHKLEVPQDTLRKTEQPWFYVVRSDTLLCFCASGWRWAKDGYSLSTILNQFDSSSTYL